MTPAYRKDIARTVRGNLKRFVSITVICALGVAMFCGLRASCTDLRDAADAYFDARGLFDIQVLSTLGLDDADIEALAAVEGVDAAEGGWSESTYTDVDGARASVEVKALSASGMNEPYVVEGRLPEGSDEVAVTQKFIDASGLSIGDEVRIDEADDPDEAVFERQPYTICGIVVDATDVTNPELSFRSSSSSDYTFIVTEGAVADTGTYTVAYLAVEGCAELPCYSDAYTERVRAVTDRIEGQIRDDREQARTDAVVGEAQDAVDEARAEYEAERADAEAELADGRAELDDAAAQLADAERQLVDGQAELDAGWESYEDGARQIADGYAELDAGQAQLDAQRSEAEAGFTDARAQIDANRATLDAAQRQVDDGRAELDAAEAELQAGEEQAVDEVNALLSRVPGAGSEVSDAEGALATVQQLASPVFDARDAVDAAQTARDDAARERDAAKAEADGLEERAGELEQATVPALQTRVDELAARKAELEAELGEAAPDDETYRQVVSDLEAAQAELEAAQTELAGVRTDLESAQARLAACERALADAEGALTEAQANLSLIEQVMGVFGITVDDLDRAVAELTRLVDGKAQLTEGRAALDASQAQLDEGYAALESGQASLDATRTQVRAALASAQDEIDAGRAELDAGAAGLPAARQALVDAQAELDRGRAEYEQGMAEYRDGLASWQEGRDEADARFADAEAQLADAQDEVDAIEPASWYVQTRTSLSSYSSISSDADSIEAIGTLFPLVFLVVAVLVSLTTITRLVEEERGLIGTYKALGYRNREIYAKYLVYAVAASLTGCAVGLFLGFIALPAFMFVIFGIMYLLPGYGFAFDAAFGLGGCAIFIVAIGGTAYLACRSEVRRTPAALMRPKAPRSGSRILLERIPAIWRRLSFLNKVTARNIFRYKRRFLMTVAGILGCTALIVCGFAIKDSVAALVPEQYDRISRYDIMAVTQSGEHDAVADELAADGRVDGLLRIYIDTATLKLDGAEESAQLIVVPDGADLSAYIGLSDISSGGDIALPDEGAVVTQNAAEVMGFSAGDDVEVQDSQLNQAEVEVAAVTGNYLGNYVYMSASAYEAAFGAGAPGMDADTGVFAPNGVLVRCAEGKAASLADELDADARFLSVTSTEQLAEDFSQSFMLINAVVAIVLGMAAALAFAVLFTLSTTNISERERELATIKVLGFRPREVHHYVNKETIILTLIGIVCGLPFGYVLGDALLHVLRMPQISFMTVVEPVSYVLAAVLPLAFALAVNLITNRTLNRIDMIEALKSVE